MPTAGICRNGNTEGGEADEGRPLPATLPDPPRPRSSVLTAKLNVLVKGEDPGGRGKSAMGEIRCASRNVCNENVKSRNCLSFGNCNDFRVRKPWRNRLPGGELLCLLRLAFPPSLASSLPCYWPACGPCDPYICSWPTDLYQLSNNNVLTWAAASSARSSRCCQRRARTPAASAAAPPLLLPLKLPLRRHCGGYACRGSSSSALKKRAQPRSWPCLHSIPPSSRP